MDATSPNYSSPAKDLNLRTGLLYGGTTLLLVLVVFFVLNYFNILSLSQIYPKTFGWLPHQSSQSVTFKKETVGDKNSKSFNPIFKSQTALIEGLITKVEGNTVTVSAQGLEDKFNISSRFTVYESIKGNPSLKPAGGEKDIQIGKAAVIILEANGNKFEVVSIKY